MMRTATTATTATSVTMRVAISRESFKLSGPGLGGVARHPWTRAVGRRCNRLLPPSVVTTLPSASIRQPPTAPCPPTLLHLQAGRSRLRLRPQILSTLGMHIHPLLKVAQLTLLIHRSPTVFHFLLGAKHLALLAYHSSPLPLPSKLTLTHLGRNGFAMVMTFSLPKILARLLLQLSTHTFNWRAALPSKRVHALRDLNQLTGQLKWPGGLLEEESHNLKSSIRTRLSNTGGSGGRDCSQFGARLRASRVR